MICEKQLRSLPRVMLLYPVVAGTLFAITHAAVIGPIADVHIVNKNIAPDGFTRSCVDILLAPYRMIT